MDLYHSRLTQDNLNDLVIKYKIPRDLHPWLPLEEFVMFELPDDAIGIYHRMFDFSGVPIPFSSFLLALIKHYRVYFSQLGPLGLNKAIPDSMIWRHPSAAVDDPRPAAGSFSMADVRRLSAHVVKLRDMLEGFMGIHDFLCLPEWTDAEDLAVGTPSSKILAKAEASQKQKASTSGATSSHVAKCTSDDDDDDEDDPCVEIPLVTPLRSVAVIPSSGNQGGRYATLAAEGSNPQDYRGKGIMADNAAACLLDPAVCKTVVDKFSTLGEMVQVESLSDDQLTAKMSVLHCMMMLHGSELVARYRGLNQSHHEYVLSADSRLKDYEEKVAILTSLELQVSTLKKQVSGLNDKLSSSNASFAKSKAKGKERKKKIKSLTKSLDNLHAEGELLSLAASVGFERRLGMHQTKDEFAVVLKKMDNFMPNAHDRLAEASPLFLKLIMPFPTRFLSMLLILYRDARVSPPITKESTVIPTSKSLEVNAMVDGPDAEMNDGAAHSKSESVFVQGTSHVLVDAAKVIVVGLERVSSCLTDVVVALSPGEKGDGSLPSSAVDEEAAANPFGV
ncbi:hypothetical protein Tco_0599630 [Tanacetum coccineum]